MVMPLAYRDTTTTLAINLCKFANGHSACHCFNQAKVNVCDSSLKKAREVRLFCHEHPPADIKELMTGFPAAKPNEELRP